MFEARVQPQAFDLGAEHARLSALGPDVGAVVAFTGQVRDAPLELEHWPEMAGRQMRDLLGRARARWPLLGAIIVHRFGLLEVGAPIVLVATAAAHRAPAFAAAEYLMDWLKTSAPFWKRQADGHWVEARASDTAAATRWEQA
jgi:molybdopterin synthase catalytic subunit